MRRFVQHFRHAIVRKDDGVVLGEGPTLRDAFRDATERGYRPAVVIEECKYHEYETDTERVVLAEDGKWRLVRV